MGRGLVAGVALGVLLGLGAEAVAGGKPKRMRLASPAFADDADIPVQYSCFGDNTSPPLEWSKAPKRTKELALLVEDPDAPSAEPFVHWTIWRITPKTRELEEGSVPAGVRQGQTDTGALGYFGPCPPPGGPHRYVFRLYALKQRLDLDDEASAQEFRDAIEQATADREVLARGSLTGIYEAEPGTP